MSAQGRPPLPDDVRRAGVLKLRVTASEKVRMRSAAEREGLTLSEWVRKTLREKID